MLYVVLSHAIKYCNVRVKISNQQDILKKIWQVGLAERKEMWASLKEVDVLI
jgi:small nuclear ribonucleoprotein (snRNP)-like protein